MKNSPGVATVESPIDIQNRHSFEEAWEFKLNNNRSRNLTTSSHSEFLSSSPRRCSSRSSQLGRRPNRIALNDVVEQGSGSGNESTVRRNVDSNRLKEEAMQ